MFKIIDSIPSSVQKLFKSWVTRREISERPNDEKLVPIAKTVYCFVVNTVWGRKFVSVYGDYLSVDSTPYSYFETVTPEMRDLWKRVAIDRQGIWDDGNVDGSSLRLIKLTIDFEDASVELFSSAEEYAHNRKLAVLASVGQEVATMFQADDLFAQVVLYAEGPDDKFTQRLISNVSKQAKQMRIDAALGAMKLS